MFVLTCNLFCQINQKNLLQNLRSKILIILKKWKNGLFKKKNLKTLVLIGKTGFGKTQAMKTLLIDYNPLLIKEINALKELKPENKVLILDDLDWKDVSRETKLSIFDKDESAQVRVLYDCVTVPSDIIKVVISNFDKNIDDILNVPQLNYVERRETADSIRRTIRKIILKEFLINQKITNSVVTNNIIINSIINN